MGFFERLFGRTQQDREIDVHVTTVNARLSIENDAEIEFAKSLEKLSDKEKEQVEKESQEFLKITKFVFPRRSDYLDSKRYIAEEIHNKKFVKCVEGEAQ